MKLTILVLVILMGCNINNNDTIRKNQKTGFESSDLVKNSFEIFYQNNDSTTLIKSLLDKCDLPTMGKSVNDLDINLIEMTSIMGSQDSYIIAEIDYHQGSGAAFPGKYQLILNSDYQLIETLSLNRIEEINILKNNKPFLLGVQYTDKGNGTYNIYQIKDDTLSNVLEGFNDKLPRLIDYHLDQDLYEPSELTYAIKDHNADGFNDIIFSGQKLFTEKRIEDSWINGEIIDGKTINYSKDNPSQVIPVDFVFLYNPERSIFKELENHSEKYHHQ